MTALKKVLKPDFSDGVDRKLLKQIRDRFLQVNADRLQKTSDGLTARQRDILCLLPLLYQVNHPLLPGYSGQEIPRGVAGYVPDKTTLTIAKGFSQTFKFRADKRHAPDIRSLFIMGSTGTLAHSETSDVDMWLCHDPGLSQKQREALQQKARAIDAWANESGLELHTFLMDAEVFRRGESSNQLDAESSGSAQHYLLLDEFYRTAILMAGCYPLWWLVPPDQEKHYSELTELLLSKRFVPEKDIIDFGSAGHIPKSELAGAGLWQLYKGLDAPYKSVLKLLLAEVYAQELPQAPSLSVAFKQAVYDDELSVEALDPYLLVYRRLENYLQQSGELKRLDLVRKSFYLKVNKKLSRPPTQNRPSWQRQCLARICEAWYWPDSKFRYLDNRLNWKVDQVMQERKEVFAELNHSYRFLSQYARENKITSTITTEDLSLLGRKLYATFQKKAGKIDRINPGIAPNLWEENLALHHASTSVVHASNHGWLLYRDLTSASDAAYHPTLRKTSSLMEMLAWLYFNGMITRATRLSLIPGTTDASVYEVKALLQTLARHIELPLAPVAQQQYLRAPVPREIVLFVNVGIDPMQGLVEPGMHRLSDRTDALGYSAQRHNLVKSIDQLTFNSWNELSVHRFDKGELLLQALQAYLQTSAHKVAAQQHRLGVYCFCSQRGEVIATRVRHLFEDAREAFFVDHRLTTRRFVIEIEDLFYVLSCQNGSFRFKAYPNETALFEALGQRRDHFSGIVFDRYTLSHDLFLHRVLEQNESGKIQIFYRNEGSVLDVIVLDEGGSMQRYLSPQSNEILFCQGLHNMLQCMLEKRQLSASIDEWVEQSLPEVLFTRVVFGQETVRFQRIKDIPKVPVYALSATAYHDEAQLRFDLQCQGHEFSFYDYGERQLQALWHKIRSDESNDKQPLQVVDICFPEHNLDGGEFGQESYGTLDYVRAYREFENRISALQS